MQDFLFKIRRNLLTTPAVFSLNVQYMSLTRGCFWLFTLLDCGSRLESWIFAEFLRLPFFKTFQQHFAKLSVLPFMPAKTILLAKVIYTNKTYYIPQQCRTNLEQ